MKRHLIAYGVILVLFSIPALAVEIREGHWKVEVVDANLTEGKTCFVLEDDGSPHLVCSRNGYYHRYCYRDGQQVWHSIPVPVPLDVYNPIGIHRDSTGKVGIAYGVFGGILYTSGSGSTWDQETTYTGSDTIWSHRSYAASSLGQPHLALALGESPFASMQVFCRVMGPYGASWLATALYGDTPRPPDTYPEPAVSAYYKDPGIVFDPCNVPHIVFVEERDWRPDARTYYLYYFRYEDDWWSTSIDLGSDWSIVDFVLNGKGLHVLMSADRISYHHQLFTCSGDTWSVIHGPNEVRSFPRETRLVFEPSGNPSVVTLSYDYCYDGSSWYKRTKNGIYSGSYLSTNIFGNPCASVSLTTGGLYYCEFIPDANTPVRVEIEGLVEAPERENTSYKAVLLYDDYSVKDVTGLGNWTVESEGYATISDSGVLTTCNVVKFQPAVVSFEYTGGGVLFSTEKRIWIVTVHPRGDLDGDGTVDLKDYSILAGNWLKGV